MMFTNLLLATDGSYCALKAASAAAEVARRFEARVTIVTVYQPGTIIAATDDTPLGQITERETVKHDQSGILAATSRILDDAKVMHQCRTEYGHPAERIAEVAKQDHCDLIVLGSRGLSDVKSFLLGSVSDRVTHLAHCPVLIVR